LVADKRRNLAVLIESMLTKIITTKRSKHFAIGSKFES